MKSKKQYFVIFVMLIIVLSEINCMNYSYAAKSNVAKNEKIIYLTFDEGPGPITNKILDILKEKDVKATFFLIGNQIKENELIVK
ncbi:polysaccharide deacetylase family protein [Clostridium sp. JNZ X4-2]